MAMPVRREASVLENIIWANADDEVAINLPYHHFPFVLCQFVLILVVLCHALRSTMVNEGALPVSQSYTRDQLQAATELAGINRTQLAHTETVESQVSIRTSQRLTLIGTS